jgi:hypothetical protein
MENSTTTVRIPGSLLNIAPLDERDALVVGWVSQPNVRGTIDIVWSSLFTIFLCTWTALCLNVPDRNENKLQMFKRRAKWMFWAIIGPELVLSVAIGQWASARRSVHRFKAAGQPQWTIRHGFFADMGGILLQPKDSTPFVVNSRQLAYLVQHDYIPFPDITEAEIWDRSKADTLTKAMTIVQASWLVVQIVGRAIQRLETTTLELAAASIVFCTLGTFYCWLHKPSDVQKGLTLSIEASTAQILCKAGHAARKPYLHTPLDFIAKQSPTWSFDVMRFFGLRCDARERPLRSFPNDRFPDISTMEKFCLFSITVAFAVLHLIGWNFSFPTRTEQYLWRVSSCVFTGTTILFWTFETIAARHRFGRWDRHLQWIGLKRAHVEDAGKDVDDEEKRDREQKAAKPTPLLWEVALIMPVIFTYALARTYMIVDIFLSMRVLPLGAYNTVNVASVIPHW